MRSLALIITVSLGYALLRGWPNDWHPILRVCLAVTALLIGLMIWGKREAPRSALAKPARPARWPDYLTLGISILLVECFFLLFLASTPEKAERLATALDEKLHPNSYSEFDDAEPDFSDPDGRIGGRTDDGKELTTSGNWLWNKNGSRKLNRNGKVRPSNRPEVYLWPKSRSDTERLLNKERYLRMFTLASYEDGTWSPLITIPRTLRATGSQVILSPYPGPKAAHYEISHQPNAAGQSLAVMMPRAVTVDLPFLRETAPATYRLPPLEEGKKNYRYAVASALETFDDLPPSASFRPDPSALPEYLQLPSDNGLRRKILDVAAQFRGEHRHSLIELRKFFQDQYTYSLEIEMPANQDPLASFLTEDQAGYCCHFATATAMIGRALGFPTRIAYGWSGGRYFKGPNFIVFRGREAHAWTEILLEDHGWVIFETTPISREEGNATVAPEDEAPPLQIDASANEESISSAPSLAPLMKIAAWLGGITLIALLIILNLRRPKNRPNSQTPGAAILPDPPGYLAAFKRACSANGHPMPPGRTLRAHLEMMPKPDFADDLLTYHYGVQYAEKRREKAREKHFIHQLRIWEKKITQ